MRISSRAAAEIELQHILNYLKVGVIVKNPKTGEERIEKLDPNRGNALINGIRTLLGSKKDVEDMQLKQGDRSALQRLHQAEEELAELGELFLSGGKPPNLPPDDNGKGNLQ